MVNAKKSVAKFVKIVVWPYTDNLTWYTTGPFKGINNDGVYDYVQNDIFTMNKICFEIYTSQHEISQN